MSNRIKRFISVLTRHHEQIEAIEETLERMTQVMVQQAGRIEELERELDEQGDEEDDEEGDEEGDEDFDEEGDEEGDEDFDEEGDEEGDDQGDGGVPSQIAAAYARLAADGGPEIDAPEGDAPRSSPVVTVKEEDRIQLDPSKGPIATTKSSDLTQAQILAKLGMG